MKKLHGLIVLFGVIAIIALDQCTTTATELSSMSELAYNVIKTRYTWYTDTDIAHEYSSNREYWDEIISSLENGDVPTVY